MSRSAPSRPAAASRCSTRMAQIGVALARAGAGNRARSGSPPEARRPGLARSRPLSIICARRGCRPSRAIARPCGVMRPRRRARRVEQQRARLASAAAGGGSSQARRRVGAPQQRQLERQRRKVGVEDFGRRKAASRAAPPPATGDSRCRARAGRRGRGAGRRRPGRPAPSRAASCRCAGSKRGTRISPPSITMRMPSMVRLVSAIEVASTILRRPGRRRREARVLRRRRRSP